MTLIHADCRDILPTLARRTQIDTLRYVASLREWRGERREILV